MGLVRHVRKQIMTKTPTVQNHCTCAAKPNEWSGNLQGDLLHGLNAAPYMHMRRPMHGAAKKITRMVILMMTIKLEVMSTR